MHGRQIQTRELAQPLELIYTVSHGSAPCNPTKYPRRKTRRRPPDASGEYDPYVKTLS